jgi:hypothetical protein
VKQKILQIIQGLIFISALLANTVLLPAVAYAQNPPPQQPPATATATGGGTVSDTDDKSGESGLVPCGNSVNKPCTIAHLFRGFIVMTNYLISLAGIVAVISITYAGFRMVTSQGSETERGAAKKRLSNSIIGMILVFAAFLLVNALFSGSINIGVKDGAKALTDPAGYIGGAAGS